MYNLYVLSNDLKWIIFRAELSWIDANYWANRILKLGGSPQIKPI